MSGVGLGGMRERARNAVKRYGDTGRIRVWAEEVVALCDFIQVAREEVYPHHDSEFVPYCPMCWKVVDWPADCSCPLGRIRAALARLDSEEGGDLQQMQLGEGLVVRPGDTLVVALTNNAPEEHVNYVQDRLREQFPDVESVVMVTGAQVAAYRPDGKDRSHD